MKDIARALDSFLGERDAEVHFALARLWRDWPRAVGRDIASLARPLGHRKTTLIIGVEDSMLMQEMQLYAPALVEQANEYLGMKFFDKVQLELLGNQVLLDEKRETAGRGVGLEPDAPENLGRLAGSLDPHSPVGRCYRAYVKHFTSQEENEESDSKEE